MSALAFDTDLLRRYDRPGPRYTSYPTAPQFVESFGEAALRDAIEDSNGDPIPRRLSLYVHVPFCLSPCFYCGCNRVITRDRSRGEEYLTYLAREIERVSALFDRDREVVQLHFGGGTPNFLDPQQLRSTVEMLRRHFRFSDVDDRDISIELDPRTVMPEDIAALAAAGFNRASLGVQDVDRDVQAAVNRVQSVEQTRAVIDACRAHGMRSVNVDLIYGLPRQTEESFRRTLATVLGMRPDRFAVYSYAHLPQLFKAQRRIDAADLPDPETKLALLQAAIETLTRAGYVYIGMDHFALPDDELALAQARGGLHRNFMGYTTHADSDLVGLGVSAISHIGPTYSQHLMCQGEIPVSALERRYRIDFAAYFAECMARMAPLQDDGLVRIERDRIVVAPRGRLLLRNIAMCFDRYLPKPPAPDADAGTGAAGSGCADAPRTPFSRAI